MLFKKKEEELTCRGQLFFSGILLKSHLFVAEPPVKAFILFLAFFGGLNICWRRDDNVVLNQLIVGPVGRHSHVELI